MPVEASSRFLALIADRVLAVIYPNMRLRLLPNRFAAIGLGGWFLLMLVLGAGLLARHVIALPAPTGDAKLASSLNQFRDATHPHTWLAVHVLYAECRCSRRIATHLLSTPRPVGWEEVVLWVGSGAPDPELERRFKLQRIARGELSRLGIDAAPLLVVLDGENRARYSGGYTDRKQGPAIDDLKIMAAAQRGSGVSSLPVFGCAVSNRLERELDVLPVP